MGTATYVESGKGTNVTEVFYHLVNMATLEHGESPYNGTISTTSLNNEIRIPEKAKTYKAKAKFLNDPANGNKLFPQKRETNYADMGVLHYIACSPTWIENKETVKRQKGVTTLAKFGVVNSRTFNRGSKNVMDTYSTLGAAKKDAKELSLKYEKDFYVVQYRSNGDLIKLGSITLKSDGKEYKSKRQSKTKVYKAVHEYVFFVSASE